MYGACPTDQVRAVVCEGRPRGTGWGPGVQPAPGRCGARVARIGTAWGCGRVRRAIECGPSSYKRLEPRGISHQHGSGEKVRGVGGDVGGGDGVLARGVEACVGRSKLAFRCGFSMFTVEEQHRGVVPVGDEHAGRICKLSSAGSNHRRAAVVAHVVVDDQNAVRERALLNGARLGGPFAGTGCGHDPQGVDVVVRRGKVGRRVPVLSSEVRRLGHLQPSRESEAVREEQPADHQGRPLTAFPMKYQEKFVDG